MTRARRAAVPAVVLALALTACTSSEPSADPVPPSAPAASGTGPWPTPSTPAEPLPSVPVRQPKGGIPTPGDADQDPTEVSRGALTALSTYDTAVDTSRHQAALRTADAGWCTPRYADQLREAVPRAAPGAAWTTWTRHRAVVRPTLERADQAGGPPDTERRAYRQWTITLTPHGRDGWTGTPEVQTAYATLTRTGPAAPWRVAALSLQ
ncbi:hypothetical protein ACIGQC_29850 [Streptomyces albidoflavus]|uniref:hypothetical protein n=1 Tax=Streptomyces albidoflavus TaxID=1886 RepID=UPI0033D8101F